MATARSQRGANLVEFAVLAPLLVVLLFGIMEFAWAFAQKLNVNHGASEGARLAAVDFGTNGAIADEICGRTDLLSSITVTFTQTQKVDPPGFGVGDEVSVNVTTDLDTLTGLFDWALPSTLQGEAAQRVEQDPAQWGPGTVGATC